MLISLLPWYIRGQSVQSQHGLINEEVTLKQIQFGQRKSVAEYFDKTAKGYSRWYADDSWLGYAFCIRKSRVLEIFDKDGGEVLDVGCGPGVMVDALLERNCEYWGMDVSKEMVRQGREKFGTNNKVHFSTGTAESLNFPDNTFDAVTCMGVIEFVDNDQLALEEMIRALKTDGTLIVAFNSKYSPFRIWRDFVFYPITTLVRPVYYRFTKRLRKPHIKQRTYTEKSVRNILSRNECAVIDVVYCNFNIFLPPLEHIFPRLSTVVSRKLEHLCRGKLKWIGSCFIVKAKKL